MTTRKKYSQEFKLDAVSLVLEQGYSRAAASRNLDVNPNLLGRWVKEYQEQDAGQAFRGNGKLTAEQEELKSLRAKIKRLEMEKEILKKATVGSIRECNTPLHHLFRSLKFQHFSWSFV